jgi:hypothetical protein
MSSLPLPRSFISSYTHLPSPFVELVLGLGVLYFLVTSKLKTKERCLAFGYSMSSVHAAVVGGYALWLIYAKGALSGCIGWREEDDWTFAHVMVAYMLVDATFVAGRFSSWDIVAHHLVSAVGIALAHELKLGHGMCVRFALTELSTLPLNYCWRIKRDLEKRREVWSQLPPEVKVSSLAPSTGKLAGAGVVLLLTYLATRILTIPEMCLTCYPQLWTHRIPFVRAFGLVASTYMMGMNVFWFSKLLKLTLDAARGKQKVA